MKKLFLIIPGIFLLANCGENRKTAEDTPVTMEDSLNSKVIQPTATDTAVEPELKITETKISDPRNWDGTYFGIIPCAGCEGVERTITIEKDMSYSITTRYRGKKDTVTYKQQGLFNWNSSGTIITLNGLQGIPSKYQVEENMLTQLDMNGNLIQGPAASQYQLKKQSLQ